MTVSRGYSCVILHAALALAACKTAPPAGVSVISVAPSDAGAEGAPHSSGDAAPAPADASDSAEPHAYLVRASGGGLVIVRGGTRSEADAAGELVCDLGHPALLRKLTRERGVLARLERASASAPASLYVKLDLTTAPAGEAAQREVLRATGAVPQTIAGDIATVRVAAEHFGALLAVPWVAAVEPPSFARPR